MTDRVRLHRRQCPNGVIVVRCDLADVSNALLAFLSVDDLKALGDVPRHDLTINRPTYDNLPSRLHRDVLYTSCISVVMGVGVE